MHLWQFEHQQHLLLAHLTGSSRSWWSRSHLSVSTTSSGGLIYILPVCKYLTVLRLLSLRPLIVFNACFLPLIYFFYPETKNLSLEQIDELFTGEKVLLHWKGSMSASEMPNEDLRAKFGEKMDVQHVDHGTLSKASL